MIFIELTTDGMLRCIIRGTLDKNVVSHGIMDIKS